MFSAAMDVSGNVCGRTAIVYLLVAKWQSLTGRWSAVAKVATGRRPRPATRSSLDTRRNRSLVTGSSNLAMGSSSLVTGSSNLVMGSSNLVMGSSNLVTDSSSPDSAPRIVLGTA